MQSANQNQSIKAKIKSKTRFKKDIDIITYLYEKSFLGLFVLQIYFSLRG